MDEPTQVVAIRVQELGNVTARHLSSSDFNNAETVAQIFSAIFFAGLGVWLIFTNGTSLSFVQRASLEKRLTVCSFINTYVAVFSAFFNFFQLTEVDNIVLPERDGFVLDFSRPFEWIVTCPMMQLVLVLMGGSKIPEYRRLLMPALSALVLCFGVTSMLSSGVVKFVAYGCGLATASFMWYNNQKQIYEHSNGEEGIFRGDSEFRKASVLLIATWFPFPIWYALSPEGFGVVDSVLLIQVGWAFLNILSKFSFIFYIQRIKDNYCNRLKVKREMMGQRDVHDKLKLAHSGDLDGGAWARETSGVVSEEARCIGELQAVVIETMNFLGMAQHTDRFMRLLRKADIASVATVEKLTKERSEELSLPWDLVSALQRRIAVWGMEMRDLAEVELERGEAHYREENSMNFSLIDRAAVVPTKPRQESAAPPTSMEDNYTAASLHEPKVVAAQTTTVLQESLANKIVGLEEAVRSTMQMTEQIAAAVHNSDTALIKKVDALQNAHLQQALQIASNDEAASARMEQRMEQMMGRYLQSINQAMPEQNQHHQQQQLGLIHRIEELSNQSRQRMDDFHSQNKECTQRICDSFQHDFNDFTQRICESIHRDFSKFDEVISGKVEGAISKIAKDYEERAAAGFSPEIRSMFSKFDEVLTGKIECSVSKIAKDSEDRSDNIARALLAKTEEMRTSQFRHQSEAEASFTRKMEENLDKAGLRQEGFSRKIEEQLERNADRCERSTEALGTALQGIMKNVLGRSDALFEAIRKTELASKDGLSDLRQGLVELRHMSMLSSMDNGPGGGTHAARLSEEMSNNARQISEIGRALESTQADVHHIVDSISPRGGSKSEGLRAISMHGSEAHYAGGSTMGADQAVRPLMRQQTPPMNTTWPAQASSALGGSAMDDAARGTSPFRGRPASASGLGGRVNKSTSCLGNLQAHYDHYDPSDLARKNTANLRRPDY